MNKIKFQKSIAVLLAIVMLFIFGSCGTTDEKEAENEQKTSVVNEESGTIVNSEKPDSTTTANSQKPNNTPGTTNKTPSSSVPSVDKVTPSQTPAYTSSAYVIVNNNIPNFTEAEKATTKSFEKYSNLDSSGRCGVAFSCIGKDIMPTGERGEIGQIKPSGWQTVKYDCVDGKYLYNRCHLIGWQLTGENANNKNLITGTRYMNVEGMLPFENMVDDYIEETNNHVLYRVTPVFQGNELVARGVQIEAYSVEDGGDGICFNVYCFNVQPGVKIDYKTGHSTLSGEEISKPVTTTKPTTTQKPTTTKAPETSNIVSSDTKYILNTSTKKIHYPSCASAKKIDEANKKSTSESKDSLIAQGYTPCGNCKP